MFTFRVRRLALGLVVTVCVAVAAFGAAVLDQHQEGFAGGEQVGFLDPGSLIAAQTFTPAISGLLDSIEIHSGEFADSGSGAKISIHTTSAGLPTDTSLGSAFGLTAGYVEDEWNAVDLASQNIFLTAGTTYALVLETTAPSDYIWWDYDWWVPGHIADPYAGGAFYVNLNDGGWTLQNINTPQDPWYVDAMFRTYMDPDAQQAVPEPMTLAFYGIGLIGVAVWKRCRSN
jgi:hypothetical protein